MTSFNFSRGIRDRLLSRGPFNSQPALPCGNCYFILTLLGVCHETVNFFLPLKLNGSRSEELSPSIDNDSNYYRGLCRHPVFILKGADNVVGVLDTFVPLYR